MNVIKRIFRCIGVAFTMFIIVNATVCSRSKEAGMQTKRNGITTDRLDRAERYYGLHPAFQKAFAFLRQNTLPDLAPGRHDIDGDRLYCMISKGPGKKREAARLEAHRKYMDIQYIISGTDSMGWKPTAACTTPDQAYDATKDIEFFKDKPQTWTKVSAGSFAVFFPEDSHAPMVGEGEIHKAIMKVAVE